MGNWIEDRYIIASQGLLWLFAIVVVFGPVAGACLVLIEQGYHWLQHGYFVPRDGHWLYALYQCGEAVCRNDSLMLTDWVGLSRLLNWSLDLHVSVYAFFVAWLGFLSVQRWYEFIEEWKAREIWLRAPPPPPDDE